jgi:hypothetical protein
MQKAITGFLIWLLLLTNVAAQNISSYTVFTGWAKEYNSAEELILLRHFRSSGHSRFLAVSPQTLKTCIVDSLHLEVFPATWTDLHQKFRSTAYIKALEQAGNQDVPLQDAGLTTFSRSQKGIDLTIDLCPSHHPLDRIVFSDLIHTLGSVEKPVPMAISVTGIWMNTHSNDLHWLDSLNKAGVLDITWVNHTYNHYVSKSAPLKENFMLEPGTDINAEVLKTEVSMLERELLPSVFFRFPGLVSDKAVYDKILNFGLIPVGSDAWLAKGQVPGNGSIVLIHANGNEPVGVKDFIGLLKNHQQDELSGKWELFDLHESIINQENNH